MSLFLTPSAIKDDYLYGGCNIFVAAAKFFLEAEIVCLLENRLITASGVMETKESLIHCFLKVSETQGFDAKGIRSIHEIIKDYAQFSDLNFWMGETKSVQEVLNYGYPTQGVSEVIAIAKAREYIMKYMMDEIIHHSHEQQKPTNLMRCLYAFH